MYQSVRLVSEFIRNNDLLDEGELYLVALSGGADSVCLLLMMKALGYRVEAIHCNFHLRGEESDRDESFCKSLCQREDIPFHLVHFDTRSYAELHGVSIEMAARDLRYGYFEQLRNDIGAAGILVAHHQDDSVETLLMNLVRGTGIHGLQGIKPRNGYVIRPLLCLSRRDIETYLNNGKQEYVTDSSNLVDDVVRNKIRLDVLPLLRTINPSVSDSIALTARRIQNVADVYDQTIRKAVEDVSAETPDSEVTVVDIPKLQSYSYKEDILFRLLQPLGFNPTQIEEISAIGRDRVGKRWNSPSHTLAVDRNTLLIRKNKQEEKKTYKFPETGVYILSEESGHTQKISLKEVAVDALFKVSREKDCVCLDSSKITFPLTLRHLEAGDRFTPFGMHGSKLVSDYLTDHKKTVFEKEDQWILTDATGKVMWLVGERPDSYFCISKNTIKSIVARYYK